MSVEIETCDNVELMAMRENVQTAQPGKYKFINQVIDGMTIQINEVNITFRDPAFYSSVQVILLFNNTTCIIEYAHIQTHTHIYFLYQ